MSQNCIALLLLSACAVAQPQPAVNTAPGARKLVTTYCVGCHNAKFKSGDVALDSLDPSAIADGASTWERVLRKVRTGEMPPVTAPKPPVATRSSFTGWLEGQLNALAAARPNPGSPVIHRLNRAEYSNAIRDLFALEMDNAASLPADDSGYGFDNIGEVLTVSPLLMEKYMSAARRVVRTALGSGKPKAALERIPVTPATNGETSGDLPLSERGGESIDYFFPADAEYSIVVRVGGNPAPDWPAPRLDLRIDGARAKVFDVQINPAEEAQHTRNYELRLPIQAGRHEITAGFLAENSRLEGVVPPRGRFSAPPPSRPSVSSISIGGPFDAKGPGETASRQRILTCRPEAPAAETPCARQILSQVARRAYRRPVSASDIDPLMKLYAMARADGGDFEAGIEMGLRAILVSPRFLFRSEAPAETKTPAAAANHRVSDLELASRLSFFLWSSIPDDELLSLAEKGRLRPMLDRQIRRMLTDPRAKALVENFGGQWLHLRNVSGWSPDPEKFNQFDEPLRYAFQRETELFFEHLIREDRPVTEFLSANYTFLNDRLARHYGVDGVRGAWFRRVPLTGEERGGILTHGSILMVTSYPTRTSPVLRGKWILENILAAPPPPPPPNVPALDEKAITATDLRKALEQHRSKAACASCHSQLDPLGFALENYDAVGRFRKSEGGAVIDASSQLPGGTAFTGAPGLKQVVLERSDRFVECVTEKLLTYALGRGLEYYDQPVVRDVRRQAALSENRFSALVTAIAKSVPFQMRRTSAP